ncbi:MAG TPA: hypothetical protein VEC57_08730 [Candidatus Limnocylindrales bacterium]|nr:hypothetical protein [Candidatus Limnocylindrales bacterium]
MQDRSIRPVVWLAVIGGLTALALVLTLLARQKPSAPDNSVTTAKPQSSETPSQRKREPGPRLRGPSDPSPEGAATAQAPAVEPPPYIDGWLYGDLDLREVQLVMPDNLYWELASPTKDEAVLEARAKEKARRNEEYGRVLAGDANEEEVHAYYDYRERLSTDFLEFADYVKRRFGDKVDERFAGMLDLAIKLHTARLAQIPNDRQMSIEHSRQRARAREEWQRQQAEFGDAPSGHEPG